MDSKLYTSGYMNTQTVPSSLDDNIAAERQILITQAQKLADNFWAELSNNNSSFDYDKRCRIGTRVRIRKNHIDMMWYRNVFFKKTPNAKKYTIHSIYIKKDKHGNYSHNLFSKEPLWGRDLFKKTEKQYCKIRKKLKILKEIQSLKKRFDLIEC